MNEPPDCMMTSSIALLTDFSPQLAGIVAAFLPSAFEKIHIPINPG
jgi:hypothetical protein